MLVSKKNTRNVIEILFLTFSNIHSHVGETRVSVITLWKIHF